MCKVIDYLRAVSNNECVAALQDMKFALLSSCFYSLQTALIVAAVMHAQSQAAVASPTAGSYTASTSGRQSTSPTPTSPSSPT